MKALRPDTPNFDEKFLEALRKYRAVQNKSRLRANGVCAPMSGSLCWANRSTAGLSISVRELAML
jgi:hypothetical protein